MIVDAHVHLFPDKEVGKQIVEDFQRGYGVPYHSFGTPEEYLADMKRGGIDYGVILSFAPDNQPLNRARFSRYKRQCKPNSLPSRS